MTAWRRTDNGVPPPPPCSFSWLTDSLPVTQHRPMRRRLQPAAIIRAAIVVLDVLRERPGKSKKPRANVRSLVGGDRGIRTLEPLNTTNTLAGCPYRPLRHVSMLHIGATTWHLTIVPRTSATRCAARGVIRGLTAGQRAGFESPVNMTITATITSATPAISRRPALRPPMSRPASARPYAALQAPPGQPTAAATRSAAAR